MQFKSTAMKIHSISRFHSVVLWLTKARLSGQTKCPRFVLTLLCPMLYQTVPTSLIQHIAKSLYSIMKSPVSIENSYHCVHLGGQLIIVKRNMVHCSPRILHHLDSPSPSFIPLENLLNEVLSGESVG